MAKKKPKFTPRQLANRLTKEQADAMNFLLEKEDYVQPEWAMRRTCAILERFGIAKSLNDRTDERCRAGFDEKHGQMYAKAYKISPMGRKVAKLAKEG